MSSPSPHTDYAMLAAPMSKAQVDELSAAAARNEQRFERFFEYLFSADNRVAWHAAWVIEKVSEHHPELFDGEKNNRLVAWTLQNHHGGLQRLCLSILLNLPLPNALSVPFINRCFEQMSSLREPVAVQVLSLKMLEKIAAAEPNFVPELVAVLENLDAECYSVGFQTARKTILNRL